jgi:peptide/nickel transport system ATP-binding protein
VEFGPTEAIFAEPKHPYTASLLKAIPDPDPDRAIPRDLPRGEVPDAVRPPLGCAFHPRCPRAFEICGWESRDLRAAIEARWAALPEEEYERERAIVGALDELDDAAGIAQVPASSGHSGKEVLALLQAMREATADDPLWRGVRSMTAEGDHARVELRDAMDPRLRAVGDVEVSCHLHDPEALAKATTSSSG